MTAPDPLRSILHRLRDSALYLPNETFANPRWEDAATRVLILRLSSFRDVARSSTHILLAREVRAALPTAWIDMAFLPLESDARRLQEAGLPLIVATQSGRSLQDFSLVLVSNSYLLEQVNLPYLLARSGVPVWSSQRDERWPAIILGGSNASAAHGLVSDTGDSVVDAIFFGEGEGKVGAIAAAWMESARATPDATRRERLEHIARATDGLWVAGSADARIVRSVCPREEALRGADLGPVLPGPEAATARLAITLGCPCLCTFCFEGHDRKPFRQIPLEQIARAARLLKQSTGAVTLEIESFNFNTHRELPDILLVLHRLFYRVNLMSQRADILAEEPQLLDLEIAADKHSFTLGIEGISERQRRFLHKSLDERQIRRVLEETLARPVRELKLFYLLTGRETEEDFAEFSGLLLWLKDLQRRSTSRPRVLFSFGMLVRMPFTPLRHDPAVLDERRWRAIAGKAKSICQTNGFEFRLALPWPTYAATQALASAKASALVEKLAAQGDVSDSGLNPQGRQVLSEWLAAHGAELELEKPRDYRFPFAFLESERETRFLYHQYEEAKAGHDRGYGTPRPAGSGRSLRSSIEALQAVLHQKRRLVPVRVLARVPREAAGFGREWTDAWLARTLFRLHPELVESVLCVRESLIASLTPFGELTPWFGETTVDVFTWDAEALRTSLRSKAGAFQELAGSVGENLRLRVELPVALFPDAPDALASFLRDRHGPVTLKRNGPSVELIASAKAIQKKLLRSGSCRKVDREAEGIWRFELDVGPRFPLEEWLSRSPEPGGARRAMVEVLELSRRDQPPEASSR